MSNIEKVRHMVTPTLDFTNILRASLSYKSAMQTSFEILFMFVYFCERKLATKGDCKMLMKSTPGVNFINILQAALTSADTKNTKKKDSLTVFLGFWDLRS